MISVLYLTVPICIISYVRCYSLLQVCAINSVLQLPREMGTNVINANKLTDIQKEEFRNKYDVFFFDMDGTVVLLNKNSIPGAREAIEALVKAGKKIHLFTDSCSITRKFISELLKNDFPIFTEKNIITAPCLMISYLKKRDFKKKIYAIGEPEGIIQEFKDAGFQVLCDNEVRRVTLNEICTLKLDPDVGAVVVGADVNFSYLKLARAVNYLKDPACLFLVSHLPTVALFNPIIPGAGSLITPMEAISNRKAESCAKSTPESVKYIKSLGYDMRRCLFIGDGQVNDIACGNLCGMDTMLVLSGAATYSHIESAVKRDDKKLIPTYYADSIAVLREIYE